MLKEMLVMFGGYTAAVATLGWLTKSLVSQFLKKDADRQKALFDAGLAKLLHKLSKLHDKRVDLIPELHYHLEMLRQFAHSIHAAQIGQKPVPQDYLTLAASAAQELVTAHMKTKLYLPTDLAQRIEEIVGQLCQPILAMQWSLSNDATARIQAQMLTLGWEQIDKTIPSLLAALEHEFREIIGTRSQEGQQSANADVASSAAEQ